MSFNINEKEWKILQIIPAEGWVCEYENDDYVKGEEEVCGPKIMKDPVVCFVLCQHKENGCQRVFGMDSCSIRENKVELVFCESSPNYRGYSKT